MMVPMYVGRAPGAPTMRRSASHAARAVAGEISGAEGAYRSAQPAVEWRRSGPVAELMPIVMRPTAEVALPRASAPAGLQGKRRVDHVRPCPEGARRAAWMGGGELVLLACNLTDSHALERGGAVLVFAGNLIMVGCVLAGCTAPRGATHWRRRCAARCSSNAGCCSCTRRTKHGAVSRNLAISFTPM